MKSPDSAARGRRPAAVARPVPAAFEFAAGTGRHRVWGTVLVAGEALSVNLVGGDVPHVGAVAVSIPRPSLADPRRRSATTSVLTLLGHKEDELARPFASELARSLNRTAVVVAGVHLRQARAGDILRVFASAGEALETIVAKVRRGAGRAAGPPDGRRKTVRAGGALRRA